MRVRDVGQVDQHRRDRAFLDLRQLVLAFAAAHDIDEVDEAADAGAGFGLRTRAPAPCPMNVRQPPLAGRHDIPSIRTRRALRRFVGEHARGMLGVEPAAPGAFRRFLAARLHQLPHLRRHQAAERRLLPLEDLGRTQQPGRAVGERIYDGTPENVRAACAILSSICASLSAAKVWGVSAVAGLIVAIGTQYDPVPQGAKALDLELHDVAAAEERAPFSARTAADRSRAQDLAGCRPRRRAPRCGLRAHRRGQ